MNPVPARLPPSAGVDRAGTGSGRRISRLESWICREAERRLDPTLDGILFAYILSIEWGGHAIVGDFLCIL